MRWRRRALVARRILMTAGAALLAGGLAQLPAQAATTPAPSTASPAPSSASSPHSTPSASSQAPPGPTRLSDPATVLPSGWQQSADEAVTVSGDPTGLHVLAASEASGYAWRTVATLGDPAVQTDLWIGQACVTAAGRYAVVVYAPEQAANMAAAQGELGRAAVVNLSTGAVTDLGGGFSIAYFNPGCGTGSQVVLTKGGWANDAASSAGMTTTLVLADAATGKVSATVKVAGQVTSAVPYGGQIAAAGGRGLEQVSTSGQTRLLAATATVPFRLTPAADGSLGYQTVAGTKVGLWHMPGGGHPAQVGSAPAGSVELRQVGGKVWLVGPQASKVTGLPAAWQPVDAPATAQPSTTGTLAVTDAESATPAKGQQYDPSKPQPVAVSTKLLAGKGGTASFKVATTAAPRAGGKTASTTAATSGARTATLTALTRPATSPPGSPSTPVSPDRTCSIPLDDPTVQAYQPTFKQVEWAVDQAVQGTLTGTRPANLYGSSLPSYSPQSLFPPPPVLAGGGHLPAQVLLGVLTAESNLQQASMHVIQGQTSNPLSSFNWYGNWINGETIDTGMINWSASDCGYGIGQITSGMCLAGNPNMNNECAGQAATTLSPTQQLAAAVDYQANIAGAASLLMDEWNTLAGYNISPTGTLPQPEATLDPYQADYVNQWYMAIWAYNSGLEPGSPNLGNTAGCNPGPSCTDSGGNWGLGYADNPINPIYAPDRPNFLNSSSNPTPVAGASYSPSWDASHPQYWPYQEKVIAWGFNSITLWDYSQGKDVQAYAFAHGNTTVPAYATFCTAANHCNASGVSSTSATAPDSCQLTGNLQDHCWWNQPAAWAGAGTTASCIAGSNCGLGAITYASGAADPGAEPIAAKFAQTCASSLPANAVIVGEGGKSALGCPNQNWTSQGSFTWNFASDSNGNYSSKIYFDQIGAGFGGHFWFGYAQPAATPTSTVITGTWNPPSSVSGWTDIQVAIPSYGANANGADYQVSPGGGTAGKNVLIDQGASTGSNVWVDLGDFDLSSGASVSLSNVTPNTVTIGVGVSGQDLAWSAAAFIPTTGPNWTYTAMGDSYSSGEGNPPYDVGTAGGCDRSNAAFGRQFAQQQSSVGSTGIQHIACSGATTNNLTTTGQNGEQPQISQISTGAKLVTVTIGGNDLGTDSSGNNVGFANILTYCMTNQATCESNYNSDDGNNLYTLMDTSLKPRLTAAYQAIQARAPEAKVVAVTYPMIFQPGGSCLGNAFLPVPDVQFLISVGLYLDNTIMAAAKAAGINVLDERYAFLGHQVCSASPYVYPLTSALTPGQQFLDTSALFHPTAAGHLVIAQDLGQYWQALQAGGAPAVWPQVLNQPSVGWLPKNLPYGIPTNAQATTMLNSMPTIANPPTSTQDNYSDSNFGTWPGTRNGWTTRNTVLAAQALTTAQGAAANVTVGSGNVVIGGTWEQPYDTNVLAPTSPVETPCTSPDQTCVSGLPVDHFVARANAWITGADAWPAYNTAITMNQKSGPLATTQGMQMLYDFSNDLSGPQLLIVGNSSNSSKSDRSPENWIPDNQGMYCAYAKMWIAVKWQWFLKLSTKTGGTAVFPDGTTGLSEKTALQNMLSKYC